MKACDEIWLTISLSVGAYMTTFDLVDDKLKETEKSWQILIMLGLHMIQL